MANGGKCPFTGVECDGGEIGQDGMIGCVFKAHPDNPCGYLQDVPEGTAPRDFYNETILLVTIGTGETR